MSETVAAAAEAPVAAPVSTVMGAAADAPQTAAPTEEVKVEAEAPKEEVKAPVVPEKYEYTPPDGIEKVDAAQLEPFEAKAKEAGLTQEQFKQVVDFALQRDAANASSPQKAWESLNQEWTKTVFADPNLGDGVALKPEVSADIARAMKEFGNPELTAAMAITGAGNNPEFVRFVAKIGKAMGVAGPLQLGKPLGVKGPRDMSFDGTASRMYPNPGS